MPPTRRRRACPATTRHTVTGLTNGTAYKFKVRAVNSAGNGTASAESGSVTPALSGACNRTAEIRDEIVNEISGKTCSQITANDLDDITSLSVTSKSTLTSLQAGATASPNWRSCSSPPTA